MALLAYNNPVRGLPTSPPPTGCEDCGVIMPLPFRCTFAAAVLAAGWLGFCAMPQPALAEVVLLKSGARVEGEILNPTRAKDDLVEVQPVEGLKLTLSAAQVKGVLVQTKVLKDYEAAV